MRNNIPSMNVVNSIRAAYPAGTRVELVEMNDPQAPPPGTHGTVAAVDDIGTIFVKWDNGSGLGVAYGVDVVKKVCEQ